MGDATCDEAACTRDSLAARSRPYAEYAGGNRAAVFEALADDVVWRSPGPPGVPWSGTRRGRAGVEAYFAALAPAVRVVGFGAERGFAAADMLRLRGGRIAGFREFHDAAGVLEAVQWPKAA